MVFKACVNAAPAHLQTKSKGHTHLSLTDRRRLYPHVPNIIMYACVCVYCSALRLFFRQGKLVMTHQFDMSWRKITTSDGVADHPTQRTQPG